MENQDIIVKVYENKSSGQQLVTIPKKGNFKVGELVRITKIKIEDAKANI